MAFANLHTHTLFSDASLDPAELVKQVYNEPGLEVFALTDHDSMSGIEPLFRAKKQYESDTGSDPKTFVPGIEMSLAHETSGLIIHIIGLFPRLKEENLEARLREIDAVLGEHCRYRCLNRRKRDLDARAKIAFDLNLDGLAESYGSAEEVIKILEAKADERNQRRLRAVGKEGDIIQHPIPITYQAIIDYWEEIVPSSTQERITLYSLRPDQTKIERLTQIYIGDGMGERAAETRAREYQGILNIIKKEPFKERGMMEGLNLLQRARAVTLLAHPAVDHHKVGFEDYDKTVLDPLIAGGLDGIEVFYPYDRALRDEAIAHYGAVARKRDLLVAGGTDYHGDGRAGLADVKLPLLEVERIMHHR
jgi:predicted metal-dependent phosphoesterase TrpH